MYSFDYFSLNDKNTDKEVYTSPAYLLENSEAFDFKKIFNVFKFYFDRINSSIKQQLESPRLNDEQKKNLKYISPNNFKLSFTNLSNDGGYHKKTFWTKEMIDFSDMKNYSFS